MESGISSSASDLAYGESGGSDLADLAGQTPIWCHQCDGANGEACFGQCFRSGQWGSQAANVHKLGAYDGVIRLAREHLGLSAALLRANMPLLRPFFSFVLATTGDTVPSGASPATELLERMRSRDLMCGREGLD
jgi:hypothetical protein